MKIGTDVDMQTNIAEGYMIAEFKVRELYPNGRKKGINPDCPVRFYCHFPEYILKEADHSIGEKTIVVDSTLSANDLWELYVENKEGIDSLVGMEHNFPEDEYTMLNLASDINAECGLP